MSELTLLCTFLWWCLFCFGMVFLAADAHIFGCDAQSYEERSPQEARQVGMIPLRQFLLRVRFFRELLRCYFCTGVWCGMIAHALFRDFYGHSYWLWHPGTVLGWVEGLVIAAVVSATVCYILDLVLKIMEKKAFLESF